MEVIHGYTITSDWRAGQKGQTAKAEKGGKKYFLKKYTRFVLATDDGMFDAKTKAAKKRDFDSFVETRKSVIDGLRPAAGPGGNIIIPCDAFVHGVHYYEATEFIDGVIPDNELEDFLSSLSYEEKMLMMKTAAGALSAVHSARIIHSDLKLKNILVAKNSMGRFVAKIIDFDTSYPEYNKKHMGGDEVYASPELSECMNFEGDDKDELNALIAKVTSKTDIFSLGVIYHYYLTGDFPKPATLSRLMERQKMLKERAGKPVVFYPSFILSQGCEFKLDDSIKSINLRALILDMLNKDPEKRPTAMQVLTRLRNSDPTIETPWPEHGISFDNSKLAAAKIVGIRKITEREKKYEVFYSTGKREVLTKDQMISKGYTKAVATRGFEEPWPEHSICWDETKLKNRSYLSLTRTTKDGIKGYSLARADGVGVFFTAEKLLFLKYALKKTGSSPAPSGTSDGSFTSTSRTGGSSTSAGSTGGGSHDTLLRPTGSGVTDEFDNDTPWPEHNIEFDMDAAKARGVIKIQRKERDGKKGYELTKTSGIKQFIPVSTLIIQKMAKKK